MNRIHLVAVGVAVFALAGCGKEATSTATTKPGTQTPGEKPGKNRKLTVKAPGTQNVTRDMTTEFSVLVDRDNFAGPINHRGWQGLPDGDRQGRPGTGVAGEPRGQGGGQGQGHAGSGHRLQSGHQGQELIPIRPGRGRIRSPLVKAIGPSRSHI